MDSAPPRSEAPTHELSRERPCARLIDDTAGAVFAEYVTLLVLVGLGAAAGTAALGIPLLRLYRYAQMMISLPFP